MSFLIAAPVTLIIAAKWRDILLHAFDPAQARAAGLPVDVIHYGLLAILSATIVATLTAVGLILAVGLLIAPGAIAFLLTKRFDRMLILSVLVTLGSMFAGIYLSFFIDSAPAPTIILILTGVFTIAFIHRLAATRRASRRIAPAE